MTAYDAGVSWLRMTDKLAAMESSRVVVHFRHLFVNGRKLFKLTGCDVERMPNNTVQISAVDRDICCKIALQNAMEAEAFAGQCCAAAITFSPEKHQNVNRMQLDKKSRDEQNIFCSTEPRALGKRWQAPVLDFGGRLAELLLSFDANAVRGNQGKLRRLAPERSFWCLMQCSYSMLSSIILGVKERRAFVENKLAFDEICTAVRGQFPKQWAKLRGLQCSSTLIEDRQVAMESVARHVSAQHLLPHT
eukprot:CAMPEP_0172697042 /NCGR_PEP_ID=MMETSP1074-20121228/28475_1 /TAXON_ID=2916 /ORGANISM="Ceratium fusus, Strain PA161109" /LENGTH=247 /DNA_ID=CAMNT_0013517875 /DNA_START=46 /DNA_END=789 /DNA_ORIENTATION=-